MISGLYLITNTVNKKVYGGSSVNIPSRWRQHRYDLRRGIHGNTHLQRAWNLYGEAAFQFSVFVLCTEDRLNELEQLLLDILHEAGDTYNIGLLASSGMRGRTHTEEAKRRMSKAISDAYRNDPSLRERVRNASLGRQHTEEWKEEARSRMVGNGHANGAKHSEDERHRKTLELRSRWSNTEYKKKLSQAVADSWKDESRRMKTKQSIKSAWNDPEKRQRILEGQRAARERKRDFGSN